MFDEDYVTLAEIRVARNRHIPRSVATYEYAGDQWECISGMHPVQAKRWCNYPHHVQDQLWLTQFRMMEHTFGELLALVSGVIPEPVTNTHTYRKHSKRKRLLLVLNYLAHCPATLSLR
jgi:hypothetical protein